ncbi:hypothetical protein [Sphingomonas corticis]|jgi:hypothetical protein|uniref:Secreted protein n=1 Tax=Sphingomonas corticis TaxID=2722791 RepID=A0ABX1CQU3_9SPHN|nr:hypothetical protein [Sphingomonas corticis]NJR79839.1 hypothetical protein [Sphingomonas corticis]
MSGWRILAVLLAAGVATPAAAQVAVEGNGARVDGRWGGEVGVGYGFGAAGFRLTPIVGGLIADGDTRVYGKVEATYAIPLLATIGVGVRAGEDDTTPYGTVALPLAPLLSLKGNVGDGYYALGLKLSL